MSLCHEWEWRGRCWPRLQNLTVLGTYYVSLRAQCFALENMLNSHHIQVRKALLFLFADEESKAWS